jgi:hypothetical protein
MRTYRTQTAFKPRRLRLGAAASGFTALLLVTGCGPSGEVPEAAPAVTEEAEAVAESAGNALDEAVTIEDAAGGQTQLTLDQGFLDTLRTLQVDVQPVAPATMEGSTFSFPLSGGNVTVDSEGGEPFTGMVEHEGGLQLSALGRSVDFTDLMLDADSGQVTAMVNGQRVPLINLGQDAANVARQADEIMVSQEAMAFSPEALQALTEQLNLPNVQLPETTMGQLEMMLPNAG